jgi:hypothetical protein
MAVVSSDNIAVLPAILPAPPSVQQATTYVDTHQSSSPPVVSNPVPDIAVSISPEAQYAAASARTNRSADSTPTEHNDDSSAAIKKEKRTKSAVPAGKSDVRMADEKDKTEEELHKRIERQKEEGRSEEEKLRLKEESANAEERRKDEQKKAARAAYEKQNEEANILHTAYEANRSSYANRLLITAAINGYQSKQSAKAANVIGGTTADSTALFIQRTSKQEGVKNIV